MRIEGETIETAAILFKGIIFTLPRPARHHDVMRLVWETYGDEVIGSETQGFVTSTGRFVRREPAVRIAKKARQIEAPKFPPKLYSEDLW